MRGQAFVVFKEVGEAAAAKNNLNGYPIFGKPMVDLDPIVENKLRSQTK
jgi:RNA recognition motif-containing protein